MTPTVSNSTQAPYQKAYTEYGIICTANTEKELDAINVTRRQDGSYDISGKGTVYFKENSATTAIIHGSLTVFDGKEDDGNKYTDNVIFAKDSKHSRYFTSTSNKGGDLIEFEGGGNYNSAVMSGSGNTSLMRKEQDLAQLAGFKNTSFSIVYDFGKGNKTTAEAGVNQDQRVLIVRNGDKDLQAKKALADDASAGIIKRDYNYGTLKYGYSVMSYKKQTYEELGKAYLPKDMKNPPAMIFTTQKGAQANIWTKPGEKLGYTPEGANIIEGFLTKATDLK